MPLNIVKLAQEVTGFGKFCKDSALVPVHTRMTGMSEEQIISNQAEPATYNIKIPSSLAGTLSALLSLAEREENDELGRIRPSYYSYRSAIKLVTALASCSNAPEADEVVTDVNGDIRIVWLGRKRRTELVCPYEEIEPPYLYYSDQEGFDILEDPPISALGDKVMWAVQDKAH